MADTHPLSHRPTLTSEQLQSYLTHLHRTPQTHPISSLHSHLRLKPLHTLSTLMKLHLSSIPWGNLGIHYSAHHTIPLQPASYLFNKLVTRNLGGYCMEQNILFSTILRSLGMEVYLSGARVSRGLPAGPNVGVEERGGFWGWEHCVIFVTMDDRKYLVDVGFGAGNAIEPVLLQEGMEVACQPGMRGRVVKRKLAGSERRGGGDEVWMYQNKIVKKDQGERIGVGEAGTADEDKDTQRSAKPEAIETPDPEKSKAAAQRTRDAEEGWTNAYMFTETEWFEHDFVVSNYKTSTSAKSWFTWTFVLTRMVLRREDAAVRKVDEGKEGEETKYMPAHGLDAVAKSEGAKPSVGKATDDEEIEIVGAVTLVGGKLTRRLSGGESEVLKDCKSEAERVTVLREWFGVELNDEEIEGIKGMVTELKG